MKRAIPVMIALAVLAAGAIYFFRFRGGLSPVRGGLVPKELADAAFRPTTGGDVFEPLRAAAARGDPGFAGLVRDAARGDGAVLLQGAEIAVNAHLEPDANSLIGETLDAPGSGYQAAFHAMRLAAKTGDRALFDRASALAASRAETSFARRRAEHFRKVYEKRM